VVDDLDLRDTAEVRRRVVLPVAESLLRAGELEDVVIEVVPEHRPRVGRVDTLRVAFKACGEWIEPPYRWFVNDWLCDAEFLAGELYNLLQDELAESRLAWGELRQGTFEVLPAEQP
jgi:hypothetical protein